MQNWELLLLNSKTNMEDTASAKMQNGKFLKKLLFSVTNNEKPIITNLGRRVRSVYVAI